MAVKLSTLLHYWSHLPRLLPEHHGLGADEAEGVDDNLALDALNRVHDHRDSSLVESLKALSQE